MRRVERLGAGLAYAQASGGTKSFGRTVHVILLCVLRRC